MSAIQWQRISDIFEAALALAPEERPSFLQRECADDPEILFEVSSLLEHDNVVDDTFMRPPPPDPRISKLFDGDGPDPLIGKTIGPCTVKRLIDRGGMGTVYLAEQHIPHREVALKVMHPGLVSRSVLRRFEHESEILARLRHPNIAQVFQAGTAKLGDGAANVVPYFIMEYIPDAMPLTQYAAQGELDTKARLRLMATVCEAVHHGHQRGVIHRDLKPANILVSADGQVKIIDFGVARATDSDIAVTTIRTEVGHLIGTLQYMSPEQCDADPAAIDVRSDVYSLGVILYELVCGKPPYEVAHSPIHQAARIVNESLPPRPSTIDRRLRGDLEIIVLKALEKEPAGRYQSAESLARDIEHYLANETLEARYAGAGERFIKYVRRRPWQAATWAAGILISVLTVSFTLILGAWRTEAKLSASLKIADYGSRMIAAESAIMSNNVADAKSALKRAKKEFMPDTTEAQMPWEWKHLQARVSQDLRVWKEFPPGEIPGTVRVNPHRSLVCVMIDNFHPRLIDQVTGREWLLPQQGNSTGVAFSPRGDLLATCSESSFFFYHLNAQDFDSPWLRWEGDRDLIGVAFHPTEPILASIIDTRVSLWDISGALSTSWPNRPSAPKRLLDWAAALRVVSNIAFSPDGKTLATASIDRMIRLWDVETLLARGSDGMIAQFVGHTDHVKAIDFSPDGLRLASASIDRTIRLWDVKEAIDQYRQRGDGQDSGAVITAQLAVLTGHEQAILDVEFDSRGELLASGSADHTVRVWDVRSNVSLADSSRFNGYRISKKEPISVLRGHSGQVTAVAWLRDGHILSSGRDGRILEWVPSATDVDALEGHFSSVNTVAVDSSGRYIVSGGGDGAVIGWDSDRGVPSWRIMTDARAGVRDLAFIPQRDPPAIVFVSDGPSDTNQPSSLSLMEISEGDSSMANPVLVGQNKPTVGYRRVACSLSGRRIAAGDNVGGVQIWDVTNLGDPVLIRTTTPFGGSCIGLEFLDEAGDWLIVGNRSEDDIFKIDRTERSDALSLVSVRSGQVRTRLMSTAADVAAVAFSSEQSLLASGHDDGSIRIFAVEWGSEGPQLKQIDRLEGHTVAVWSLAFERGGRRLFSGSSEGDHSIKVWELETRHEVASLHGHVGAVVDLTFDSVHGRLISASNGCQGSDNVVRLWESQATPESRIMRAEYRNLQNFVRELFQSPDVWPDMWTKQRIAGDERFSPEIRAWALEHFDILIPHPGWWQVWSDACLNDPNRTVEEYVHALRHARVGLSLSRKDAYLSLAVGGLLYRTEAYREAIAKLEPLQSTLRGNFLIKLLSFNAMALQRIGEAHEARRVLAQAQSIFEAMRDRLRESDQAKARAFGDRPRSEQQDMAKDLLLLEAEAMIK